LPKRSAIMCGRAPSSSPLNAQPSSMHAFSSPPRRPACSHQGAGVDGPNRSSGAVSGARVKPTSAPCLISGIGEIALLSAPANLTLASGSTFYVAVIPPSPRP
jgi:hypothetical protein